MRGDFLVGANLPWIRYGCDFGRNAWQPVGGLGAPGRAAAARDALNALAESGAKTVRWFLFCDGRAGIRFDTDGDVAGLDEAVFGDVDVAVGLLADARLSTIFVMTDFLWCSRPRFINGVQLGGRSRTIADTDSRSRLLDRVFAPLLERYGREAAIHSWEVMNEPDWVVTALPRVRRRALSAPALRDFIRKTVSLVHRLTRHAATVGSARPSTLPLLSGLGLDFYQVHWYDKLRCRFDLTRDVSRLGVDHPVLLGEFPTRGAGLQPGAILATARASGYAGALGWSACATDRHSSGENLRRAIERRLHQC